MNSETESPIPETNVIHIRFSHRKIITIQTTKKKKKKHLKVLQSGSTISSGPLLLPLVIGKHGCLCVVTLLVLCHSLFLPACDLPFLASCSFCLPFLCSFSFFRFAILLIYTRMRSFTLHSIIIN